MGAPPTQMMEEFNATQAVWNLAASALGALVAGFFGVRWGLQKQRGERAFDRRLEWYEKTHAALIDLSLALGISVTYRRRNVPYPAKAEAWARTEEAFFRVRNLAPTAEIYATREVAESLYRAVLGMNSHLNDAVQVADVGLNDRVDNYIVAAEASADNLVQCADAIAAEARSHLGFPAES